MPAPAARRTVLQKVRGHALADAPAVCRHRVSGSLSLPSRGPFHLSFTVLCSIGHWVVFSLAGWSPHVPPGFHVSRRTLDPAVPRSFPGTGPSPSPAGFPKAVPLCCGSHSMRSEPCSARAAVWAPPVSLAATPGIDVSFSSSGYLDVSVRRVPSSMPMCSAWGGGVFPRRVSPFRHPRIDGYVPLPAAFRSLSRLSSAPGAKASALCPSLLNRLFPAPRLAWRFLGSSRASRPAPLDTGSMRRTHGRTSPRLPAAFLFARCPMGSPPSFGSLRQYSVFKVRIALRLCHIRLFYQPLKTKIILILAFNHW